MLDFSDLPETANPDSLSELVIFNSFRDLLNVNYLSAALNNDVIITCDVIVVGILVQDKIKFDTTDLW